MMDVLLHGCNGRMGAVMTRILAEEPDCRVVCGVDPNPGEVRHRYPVHETLTGTDEPVDLIIDFSHHTSLPGLLAYAVGRRLPTIICTTGLTPDDRQLIAEAAQSIPLLVSANMSFGMTLVQCLVRQAAAALRGSFDVEIIERHHNRKADAPSGTAAALAEIVRDCHGGGVFRYGRHADAERRQSDEIGIHSIRGGTIVGEHAVIFAGAGEVIEIKHSALSTDVFAFGTLRAARFLLGRPPGLYTLRDLIDG
jgi:4-hydroxy-tetrahydrodipicolinate reductase